MNPRNAPPIPPRPPQDDDDSGPAADSAPTSIGEAPQPSPSRPQVQPPQRRQIAVTTPTAAFTQEEIREKAALAAKNAGMKIPTNPQAFSPFPQPAAQPRAPTPLPPPPRSGPSAYSMPQHQGGPMPLPHSPPQQHPQQGPHSSSGPPSPHQPHQHPQSGPTQLGLGMQQQGMQGGHGLGPVPGMQQQQPGMAAAQQTAAMAQPQGPQQGSYTPSGPHPSSMIQSVGLRAELPRDVRPASAHVVRSRAYAFVLDGRSVPLEIGSGRFAKVFLGEERWLESKTDFRRQVVIKILQKGVADEVPLRFQLEKELLERVQGHPNIVMLYASGESDDPEFIPAPIRDKVENDFLILERLDMSLEERLKGTRVRGKRDDLLACDMRERLFRVLDYMIPVASAVEYAHLVRNICHRDIKPANILVGLPDENLRGSTLEVRLTDFNVAKIHGEDVSFAMTQMKSVPGTLFFQSPEQETNVLELLVNVQQGSPEVEFFEDFYIQISKNDNFALFNRGEQYHILYSDRSKKRLVLDRPYRDTTETNVRAKIQKSVGRPADIYSLGALFYYLVSGAYANPKTIYDAFHKFIEYEQPDEANTVESYLNHEYTVIDSLRAPKSDQGANVAPADRFFTYKHYLDGNGELIDPHVMKIIARCMIRNKPDSYCQAHEVETRGISDLVQDLVDLYALYGFHPSTGSAGLARRGHASGGRRGFLRKLGGFGNRIRWFFRAMLGMARKKT